MLRGEHGPAAQLAIRLIIEAAEAVNAPRLIDVSSAHVVECLLYGAGQVPVDFARRLTELGARVRIPTTLNVGSADLVHPELNHGNASELAAAREIMQLYTDMGARPTFTCAPFQEPAGRLRFGEHVAWGESNAVSFVNSVFGARTNRYGNVITACAALTGRVPETGLHVTENRTASVLIRLDAAARRLQDDELFYPVLGHLVGELAGDQVIAVDGLAPDPGEDRIKAFGAAAAASGAVPLYHLIGITPEAPDLEHALDGRKPVTTVDLGATDLQRARDAIDAVPPGAPVTTVCLGAPHLSLREIGLVAELIERAPLHPEVDLYVATSRHVLDQAEQRGWAETIRRRGGRFVSDRCTYFPGILHRRDTAVMTDSAKWAFYAPVCIQAAVALGSLAQCLQAARTARVPDVTRWSA